MTKRQLFSLVLLFILSLSLQPTGAVAEKSQVPLRQAAQGRFKISQSNDTNLSPIVAMDYAGNFVVAWEDQDGLDSLDVQIYRADGTAVGDPFEIANFPDNYDVGMDADGDFVVTWQTDYAVKAQRYHANGVPNGAELAVASTEEGGATVFSDVSLAANASGEFVVVWSWCTLQSPLNEGGISAQRYTQAGAKVGNVIDILRETSSTACDIASPDVAIKADGAFAVTWQTTTPFSYNDILVRRYDNTGTALEEPIGNDPDGNVTVCDGIINNASCNKPTIAAVPTGRLYGIAYERGNNIYRAGFTGNTLGSSFVGVMGTDTDIAIDYDGDLVIGIRSTNNSIIVQPYDKLFNQKTLVTVENGSFNLDNPAVAMDSGGNFVVVWQRGTDIYGQRYLPSDADPTIVPPPRTFSCGHVFSLPYAECEALVALFQSAGGSSWTDNSGWNEIGTETTNEDPCNNWKGVTCTNGHITALELFSNNLNGTLPSELGNLTELESLKLNDNPQLSGDLPATLSQLQNLILLYFNDTNLTEPSTAEFQNWLDGIDDLQDNIVPFFLIPDETYDQNPDTNVVSHDLDLGPQETHLYATRFDLTGAGTQDALVVYQRDATTGRLTFMEANTSVVDPFSVAVSPDGKHVYVASFFSRLNIFQRNSDGSVTYLDNTTDGINDKLNRYIAIHPDGERLFVVGASTLTVFGRNASTGLLTRLQTLEDGVAGVEGLGGAETVTISPDGKHIYVASLSDDAVAVFEIGGGQLLQFVEAQQGNLVGLTNAHYVAVSPDGQYVYVSGYTDADGGAIGIFKRDAATGKLTYDGFVRNSLDGVELPFRRAMALSPDGAYLFVGTAVFVRDQQTGALTFAEREGDVPAWRGMIVSENSQHVYMSNAGEGDDIHLYYALPASPTPFSCANVTTLSPSQCNALVALFRSTNGANWANNNGGWTGITVQAINNPCTWYGVTCANGQVTELNLANNNLSGTLPPELKDLTGLQKLYLNGNPNLEGMLPAELASLASLTTFYFNNTNLVMPSDSFAAWVNSLPDSQSNGQVAETVYLPLIVK